MIFGIISGFSLLCGAGAWYLSGLWWWMPLGFLCGFAFGALCAFLFLWIACSRVKKEGPSQDSPFYRKLIRHYARVACTLLQVRYERSGLEKLPKDGRFLMVCNHLNDADPVVLHDTFRDSHLAFISKRENMDMFLIGELMQMTLCQMINRENDREALKTILECVSILKEDRASVCVFPEGYTSMDGLLHPFRHGVFKIAQKAKVPIVVVTLQNTQYVFRNAKRLRPTTVHLHLLGVIPPEELEGVTAVDISRRVHKMMEDDLGEDLVLKEENT